MVAQSKDLNLPQKRTRQQDSHSQSSNKRDERSMDLGEKSLAETRNAKKNKKQEFSATSQTLVGAANMKGRTGE